MVTAAPAQKIEMDLNGTGTLIDVTGTSSTTRFVLMDIGLRHQVGRSNWTAAEPNAGTFSFTLDNTAGQFTPGHTLGRNSGVYVVGVRPGVKVKWTCSSRVRFFTVTAVELIFPNGVAGGSQVAVSCVDILGRLAQRTLKTMLAEHIMVANPIAYYPLTEAAPSDPTRVVFGADVSGNNQQPLKPTGNPADSLIWANGTGPRTDGHSCVSLRVNQAGTTTANTTPGIEGSSFVYEPTGVNGGPLRVDPRPAPHHTSQYQTVPATFGTDNVWAVSMWFSIRADVFTPAVIAAAPGVAGTTDGPYVHLLRMEGATSSDTADSISLLWRIKDQRLLLVAHATAPTVMEVSNDTYSVPTSAVHHLLLTCRSNQGTPWDLTVQATIDGVLLNSNSASTAQAFYPAANPINGIGYGTDYNGGRLKGGTGTDQTVYELSGSVSHVAAYGPPDVVLTSATHTVAASMLLGSNYALYEYVIGQRGWGGGENAAGRFTRLGSYLGDATVGFVSSGSAQPLSNFGDQDTEGKTLLTALCTALAAEGRQIEATTASSVSQVSTQLDSVQRKVTPVLTIDVELDGVGVPGLAFDQSGAVSTATVNGGNKLVGSWTVDPGLAFGETRSVTIDSALNDLNSLQALAQFRTLQGRPDYVLPSTVVVNSMVSETAGLQAALLNNLRAGDTIKLVGMPAAVVGYSALLCSIVGITEVHSLNGSVFTLTVQPLAGPPSYLDTTEVLGFGPAGALNPSLGGSQLVNPGGTYTDVVTNVATSIDVLTAINQADGSGPGVLMSTDSTDYPINVLVGSEIISFTTVPAAAVAAGGSLPLLAWSRQAFTGVSRGQLGTTAAAHGAPQTLALTIVDGAGAPILEPYIDL